MLKPRAPKHGSPQIANWLQSSTFQATTMYQTLTSPPKPNNARTAMAILQKGQPHGEPGHLNIYLRDHMSSITGYGIHDRVIVTLPDAEGLYMRVDHKWGLGMPTAEQMLKVAREDQDVRGRWVLDRVDPYDDGRATDVYFKRAGQ